MDGTGSARRARRRERSEKGIVHTIRPTGPADGDTLVEIWRSSVHATHDFVSKQDLAEIEAEVREIVALEPLWLALDAAGEPLGFLGLSTNAVDALFVAAEHRGTGVGRALIDFAKSRHSWLIAIVNEQNEQALGFYEHAGFRPEGRSADDGHGRPYPVLHMRWIGAQRGGG